ncbi:BolA/IbaG family iron-sulfur metabolism protein [Sodalis-like secondary symbiont of Drepanosiphum platanoidis]|uniref:BolA/IbaG family iron-sulfur metabolism protein n=1 Tax=Sodalis-like secondary symbiont of Drepanosiphum platanoidis TaxID=2994493 RepID=UPI003464CB46
MDTKKIKNILIKHLSIKKIYVNKITNHIIVTVISQKFVGINLIERQKIIYNPLIKYICTNKIHSLSINAYSLDEWNEKNKI